MNRHSIDDPTQVGCAKQRPTVLVGTVCDYLDSFPLPVNPVSFFLFPPLFLLETVGNLLKHCPIGPSNSSIPCWKQLTMVTVPRNFWHWSVSDIDHRQIGAFCACSKCGTFLFAPLMVIVLWPQYREKIAQHMLRAIAVFHFPIYALKSCPAPAALAAGAGHYFSLTAYNLTFKPPYRGKGLKKDIS